MNFDALTMSCVRDELRATLLGGRLQHVHHPDELGVALEIYALGRSRWLYCSAHTQHARVHLVSERPPRTSDAVSPLLLLLRKYADGARVEAIEQPALERIIRLQLSKRTPDGALRRIELVVEVMGRHSNLILVDKDGAIMDAAKRITPELSRVRTVRPQQRYTLPPAQQKLDPRELGDADLARAAEGYAPERPLRELLIAEVNACSPLLAREVVYAAHGAVDTSVARADWQRLASVFRAMWADATAGKWTPCVALHAGRIVAYAPYALRSFPDVQLVVSMSQAIDQWHSQSAPAADQAAAWKRPLRQALAAALDRMRGKQHSLRQGLVDEREVARLRHFGEHLLAFGYDVAPGQTELEDGGTGMTITLDPEHTPLENARRYFERYAKAKSAAREVPLRLAAAENELRYLEEAFTHLDLAATPAEAAQLRNEWAELGYVTAGHSAKAKQGTSSGGGKQHTAERKSKHKGPGQERSRLAGSAPYRRLTVEGFDVLVGRSGKGNDALLTREAHPADTWLHARGIPGAHVVILGGGRHVPEPVLRRAAALAAAHSQARDAGSVAVDYTLRKFVSKIRGAPPGLVNYRGERTIHVPPAVDTVGESVR